MAPTNSTQTKSAKEGRTLPFRQTKRRMRQLQQGFESFLPRLRFYIRIELRQRYCPEFEDAVQEAISIAWVSYLRLASRGVDASQFVSKLAHYAVCHVRCGRRLTGMNNRDVTSRIAQAKHGFRVCAPYVRSDRSESGWREILFEDRRTTPADIAAYRLDFDAWLKTLPRRLRRIAIVLSLSTPTRETAKRFHVSSGRISQIRRELEELWRTYQHLEDFDTDVTGV